MKTLNSASTPQVLCYGELLIDFSQFGPGPLGYPGYEALPGGAPANVACALAKWGRRAAFSGQVGNDALGSLLRKTLDDGGVDTRWLGSRNRPTTMAIVSLDAHGDRSFDILWKGTSCEGLPSIAPAPGATAGLFHFGTVSMCDPEGFQNTLASARSHKEAGTSITFDPNLRTRLWPSLETAREAMVAGLALADLVKISEDEVAFVLGEEVGNPLVQAQAFQARFSVPLLFVTLGAKGCLWSCRGQWGSQATPPVQVVDTTGAGDCFMAGVLHRLLEFGSSPRDIEPLEAMALASYGVKTGTAATTRRGGIPSIPPATSF